MKVFVIIIPTILSLVLANSTSEQSTETQIQRNQIDYQTNDKIATIQLSDTVDEIASHLVKIIENIETSYEKDLETFAYSLKGAISFTWNAISDELFQQNLNFLFDELLDVVFSIHEEIDDVWQGTPYLIESKLSQILMCILQIVDEMKTLGDQSEDNYFGDKFTTINETIVDLTTSIIGLTSITASITQQITTRDRSVSLIVETITSLIFIHQYTVAAVACLLSRAAKVSFATDLMHATGLAPLTATMIDFISNLQSDLLKGATMTQLFHGDLHTKLAMQLLISMSGLMNNEMVNMIYTCTTSLLTIIQEQEPQAFHVLPDLIDQLTVISLRCGHIEFGSLEMFITYAFDGLLDILNHISYKLDKHIQSTASTGSFFEPSEPIDAGVANVRTEVKRFIHDCQELSKCDTEDLTKRLIAGTSELMRALLDPMNVVIHKSDHDYSITLACSLQFIGLYVIGLILTPLISLRNRLENSGVTISDTYSNFGAMLSLIFIKIQMIFHFSETQSTVELLEQLYESFDYLLQNLAKAKDGLNPSGEIKASSTANAFVQLAIQGIQLKNEQSFYDSSFSHRINLKIKNTSY